MTNLDKITEQLSNQIFAGGGFRGSLTTNVQASSNNGDEDFIRPVVDMTYGLDIVGIGHNDNLKKPKILPFCSLCLPVISKKYEKSREH
ncbi:hypothetical protein [Leptospira sp. GIMC2001]|uniref:hypothetical protein n=1 Tax=Leptospira sp. GIMC2001 TaxID=1513297 RepID=UPI00234BE53B|nr:hypothetical protein [Leptospira sp. GIMC2001]WCL50782.1 hypothetical protein O4O04_08210 [Leptospira sp. GIMC2001]